MDRTSPPSEVAEKGRQLLAKGIQEPMIYQIVVKRYAEINSASAKTAAEDFAHEGGKKFPEIKDKLTALLATPPAAAS